MRQFMTLVLEAVFRFKEAILKLNVTSEVPIGCVPSPRGGTPKVNRREGQHFEKNITPKKYLETNSTP